MAGMRKKLPRYMLPNQITQLASMPLTTNAKIDRVALRRLTEEKKEKPDG
jgi:acyl-coenzyme A synthetase/AMP-(fatty) acid ligase